MKRMKRLAAMLLALCILVTMLPTVTFAATTASGTCGTNLTWTLDDTGTLSISGTGVMQNLSYPSSVPWYNSLSNIKTVTIADSVTSIGARAFQGCSRLTSITIPDSVTSIGNYAFEGCSRLTSITIPDSVTSIGDYAFYNCFGLTSVNIGDGVTSIGVGVFSNCNNLNYNIYDNAKYLGDNNNPYVAVIDTTSTAITSCKIHSATKTVGNYAFSNCSSLTSVTIGDSVTSIGIGAFYNCSSLTGVIIGDSVTSIGSSAFEYSSLTNVTIPDSVTSIGDRAFVCSSLTSVIIPDGITSIGIFAFGVGKNLNYNVYNNGKYLGNNNNPYVALIDTTSTNITSCQIHSATKTIGDYAFNGCSSLETVVYCGTEEQWSDISIGKGNSALTDVSRSYHNWQAATCKEAKICSACGLIEGEALDHNYENGICTECGKIAEIVITDSTGNITGNHNSVEEALGVAFSGNTIVLRTQVIMTDFLLPAGVALDLNGYSLTADSILTYSSSSIIDSSENASGLLKINETDGNMISPDNVQIPVYDTETGGYRFFAIDVEPCAVTGGNKYWFKIKTAKFAPLYDLINADADVQIKVKMTWEGQTEDVYATADLAFTKAWADRYSANEDIYITVTVAETQGVENFKLIPIITSGGVEICGEEM